MFERITESFTQAINKIRFYDDERSLKKAIAELKKSLLKADVYHKVVKDLLEQVEQDTKKASIGKDAFLSALNANLLQILEASKNQGFVFQSGLTKVLMTGLQGSGKTTTCAKLALYLKTRKKKVLLVAADLERLAAVEQLRQLAQSIEVEFFHREGLSAKDLCALGLQKAKDGLFDVVIFDTAGRLAVDEALMNELVEIKNTVLPDEIFYVADSLTGQDAVRTALSFKEKADISSIILTKFDGNATGGLAIGLARQTSLPLRFVGTGEKPQDLEIFIPERIVSRLLGSGDAEGLAEKIGTLIDEKKAKTISKKIKKGSFNFEDFLEQIETFSKMGNLKSVIGMLPGLGSLGSKLGDLDLSTSDEIKHIKALISSMTKKERQDPELLNPSRKRRLAQGAGLEQAEVNRILKQFANVSKMARRLSSKGSLANIGSMLGNFNKGQFR
ncbi:MAG: signal recognition particle protein [Helicobacteraceae bacterium]